MSHSVILGIAAATMFMPEKQTEVSETQLRVAFDGDAVLFSDESERIFKAHGLDKFFEHEKEHENMLLDHVCQSIKTGLLTCAKCTYMGSNTYIPPQGQLLTTVCGVPLCGLEELCFALQRHVQ